MVEPLYTCNDAVESLKFVKPVLYDQLIELNPEMKIVFNDAGHISGSAITELWVTEGESVENCFFRRSGRDGSANFKRSAIIIKKADYVIMETTYGNRSASAKFHGRKIAHGNHRLNGAEGRHYGYTVFRGRQNAGADI
ncbi:MAG: hypothetical protein V8Q42_05460 [Anaerovoracaceae bacterium]